MSSAERNEFHKVPFSDCLRWAAALTGCGIMVAHKYNDPQLLDIDSVLKYDNVDLLEVYF